MAGIRRIIGLTSVKARGARRALNEGMEKNPQAEAFRRDCLAFRQGLCCEHECLQCSPVHQALRAVSGLLTRWPRALPPRPD
jgi:hypothetical protein